MDLTNTPGRPAGAEAGAAAGGQEPPPVEGKGQPPPRRIRRRLLGAAVAAAVAVLLVVLALQPADGSGSRGGRPGQVAPLFASTDLSGRPVVLSSYRGRRVLLNFWASWCIPCRNEFPVLRDLEATHPDVAVLGVVFQDVDGAAAAFMRSHGATWPGVRDPRSQIADAYGVHAKPGIPVSILVDGSGRVVARHFGPFTDLAAVVAFVDQASAPAAATPSGT